MDYFYTNQILYLVSLYAIIAFFILLLFRLRTIFGLSLLFVTIGVLQSLKIFLTIDLSIEIAPNIFISSGSSIIFTSSIFAILLIYIKEDAIEARKLIYAILAANIVLTILQYALGYGLTNKHFINSNNLPIEIFNSNIKISIIGTILFFLASILIIFVYEGVSKKINYLFLRILVSTLIVINLDSLLFAFGAFSGSEKIGNVLVSGLISKNLAVIIYSALFTLYLKYLEAKDISSESNDNSFNDIFKSLTFKQKFEYVRSNNQLQQIKLKDSENKFRTIVEQASDAYFIHDFTGKIIDINERACTNLGYTKEELLQLNIADIDVEFNFNEAHSVWMKIKQNDTLLIKGTHKRKNGTTFPVEISFGLFQWKNETLILAQARNVTKQTERELEIERYALIVESSTDMMAYIDKNFNYIAVNTSYEKAFNLTKTDILGKHVQQIFGEELFECTIKPEGTACLIGKNTTYKKWFNFPAYGSRYMDVNYTPFFNKQHIIDGFIVNARDITDVKLMEDNLIFEKNKAKNYLNVAGVMLVSINNEGIVELINPKGCEILGYPEDEVLGKNWFDNFIPKNEINKIKEISKTAYNGKIEQVKHFNNTILTKNGEERLIAWTNVVLYNDDGTMASTLSSGEDITERNKSEIAILLNEKKYKTLFEYAPEGILIANNEGYYIDANTTICSLLGYTINELIGLNASDIVASVEFEHIDTALTKINSKKQYEREWLFKRKDSSTFSAEVTATTLPDGNILAFVKDITERKELEASLLNESDRLKAIIDNIPVMITLYDPTINLLYLNKEFETKSGVSTEESANIDIMALFYPDPKIRKKTEDFMKAAPKEWLEIPFSTKSGEVLITEWTNIKLKNGTQIGIGLDITDKKKTQEELNITKDTLLNTFENMTDGFMMLDKDFNYTFLNTKAGELMGREPDSLLNKNMLIEYPNNTDQPFYDYYYKALECQKPSVFEEYYPPWDRWFENRVIPSADGLAIFFQDITQRKSAEKVLLELNWRLLLINEIDNAILTSEKPKIIAKKVLKKLNDKIDFKYASFAIYNAENDEFEITNIKTSKPKLKSVATTVLGSEIDFYDLEKIKKGEIQLINDLKSIHSKSSRIHKFIEEGLNTFVIFPLMFENKLEGALSLISENSEEFSSKNKTLASEISNHLAIFISQNKLKKEIAQYTLSLEERITERTAQLEFSNNELRNFAQVVSHDLKAPLRAISQLSYWISNDYSDKIDSAGQEQLAMLVSRVKRMDNLIEGILQYSRAGRAREKEAPINLQLIVKDVINSINPPTFITIEFENELPEILGDPIRFGQIFQNLISNAIKYMDKPLGIIKIGCEKKENYWKFHVTDNGPGIEEKYFNRIFQIFQRLESRDNLEGTGIGLTLVKRIIQIYNGEIWVTSKVNEGTTFHFTLPIKHNLK